MGFVVGLGVDNRRRKRGKRDYRLGLPQEEVCNLGDDHPGFGFVNQSRIVYDRKDGGT